MKIVGPKNKFPKVTLVDPTNSGYLLFALNVDRRPPIGFFIESQNKKNILSELKGELDNLKNNFKVIDALDLIIFRFFNTTKRVEY